MGFVLPIHFYLSFNDQEYNDGGLVLGSPEQVQTHVQNGLAYLRSVVKAPVTLNYGKDIALVVYPDNSDDRIVVAHPKMGMTTVNYTESALMLDISGEREADTRSVFSRSFARDDLMSELDA